MNVPAWLRAWWTIDWGREWLTRGELAEVTPGAFVEHDPMSDDDPRPVICGDVHPLLREGELCVLAPSHGGRHRSSSGSAWETTKPPAP